MSSLETHGLTRIESTVAGFWSLGGSTVQHDQFQEVSHPTAPEHPLGNFVHLVRNDAGAAMQALLEPDSRASAASFRRVVIDAGAPAELEALLVLHGWHLECQLQLVLPASTPLAPPSSTIRPATDDADWKVISDLFRSDHLEEDARRGDPPRPLAETQDAVALRRSLGPDVEYLLAEQGDHIIGCIAIWVSDEGVGLIEDVFVRTEARGAGVATELLRHAVHRGRHRGAHEIIIGAEIEDTPKHLYVRFGFEPAAVLRSFVAPSLQLDQGGHTAQ